MAKAKMAGTGWHKESLRHSNARKYGRAGGKYAQHSALYNRTKFDLGNGNYKTIKESEGTIDGWKYSKSSPNIKSTNEGWFIHWVNGKDEIEIIRYYDDDKGKWQDFEVWHQIKKDDDSWDGDHLASFNTEKQAVKYALSLLKKEKDSDGDGVPDSKDCAPNDPKKQHTITSIKTSDGTDVVTLSSEIEKELSDMGFSTNVEVKNRSRIDVRQVRLSDEGIKRMGYNVKDAEYTKSGERRSRVPTWEQWEIINHTINAVLDKHGTSANIKSLGGKFVIREGKTSHTDWEDQRYENVGSMMRPVSRGDLYRQEN